MQQWQQQQQLLLLLLLLLSIAAGAHAARDFTRGPRGAPLIPGCDALKGQKVPALPQRGRSSSSRSSSRQGPTCCCFLERIKGAAKAARVRLIIATTPKQEQQELIITTIAVVVVAAAAAIAAAAAAAIAAGCVPALKEEWRLMQQQQIADLNLLLQHEKKQGRVLTAKPLAEYFVSNPGEHPQHSVCLLLPSCDLSLCGDKASLPGCFLEEVRPPRSASAPSRHVPLGAPKSSPLSLRGLLGAPMVYRRPLDDSIVVVLLQSLRGGPPTPPQFLTYREAVERNASSGGALYTSLPLGAKKLSCCCCCCWCCCCSCWSCLRDLLARGVDPPWHFELEVVSLEGKGSPKRGTPSIQITGGGGEGGGPHPTSIALGALDFAAPAGFIFLPPWAMEALAKDSFEEDLRGAPQKVEITFAAAAVVVCCCSPLLAAAVVILFCRVVSLPTGGSVRLRAHQSAFFTQAEAAGGIQGALERELRHYSALTAGTRIPIKLESRLFLFEVEQILTEEGKEVSSASVQDTDVALQLLPPLNEGPSNRDKGAPS
ncbi:hypothetical protein ACSSS7_003577 [Eimeria intestinalis]